MNKAVQFLGVFLVCCLLTGTAGAGGCGGGGDKIEVIINSPVDGETFEEFMPVAFSSTALDKDGNPITGKSLAWKSNMDGEIGTGESVTVSNLSAGNHTITLTATGDGGDTASESVSIKINLATGLLPRGGDYLGHRFYNNELYWASVTVRDKEGHNITGLELEDFDLTESIVNTAGETVTESREIDINLEKEHDWEPQWFWEESLGKEKLDAVFLIETRGTMDDVMPAIREQADELIDRLIASNVDFRVAGVAINEVPVIGATEYFQFHGPGELDKLSEGMDSLFDTGGTWWNPVASYDSLLWTPWLGFREEARKVLIAITDIQPQTVYDTMWYTVDCTAMTRSAVELFLESHPDMEVYYCLNPEEPVDIDQYYDAAINPMAGDALDKNGLGSGWAALESRGYVTGLRPAGNSDPWPFDQSLIPVADDEVKDSRYYFIWESNFTWDEWDEFGGHPEEYKIRVDIETNSPDTGEALSAAIDYPLTKAESSLSIRYTSERGDTVPEGWVHSYLEYPVGSRRIPYSPHLYFEDDGTYYGEPLAGTYLLVTEDRGSEAFDYDSLRVIDRRPINIQLEGLSIDITSPMAEREMFLLVARGLLKDLKDNWRQPGEPFREFVAGAEGWLDELESEGIDFINMVRLRRFAVALSGYANMSEYAQNEIEKSARNVHDIAEGVADIVAEVLELEESTEFDWQSALGTILEIAYDVVTKGEFTAKRIALEEGLDALIEYAGGELIEEIKELVCQELGDEDYSALLCTLINVAVDLPQAAEEGDWSVIVEPLHQLAFDIALDQAMTIVADNFVDNVFAGLELSDPLQNDLKGFVKEIFVSITADHGFDDFDRTVEKFVADVVQHSGEQYFAGNRDEVVDAINGIFEKLKDETDQALAGVEGSGFVRDFLIGMVQDIALVALPEVKANGAIDYDVDGDALVRVVIEHTLYHVFLKNYFVDEVNDGLYRAMTLARDFVPDEEDFYDWESSLHEDLMDYRRAVGDLQEIAWDALRTQEDINNWAQSLDGLVSILEPLGVALDFMAKIYPPLQDTADEVDDFVSVLDGFQVVAEAIELALRVDSLDTFGNKAERIALMAFGEYEE